MFDAGKEEYVLSAGDPAVGALVKFKLNGKGELEVVSPSTFEGVVSEVDGYYVTIIDNGAEETIRFDADAVGYKLKTSRKIDKNVRSRH